MAYITRDEAYRFVSKMRDKEIIGREDEWEYVGPPRREIVTSIDIYRKVSGRKYKLSVNTFNGEIIGELYTDPEYIPNAFKAMEQMPYGLLKSAELMYVSKPNGYIIETNIFSEEVRDYAEMKCRKYPNIGLIYSFVNGSVTTRRWEFRFDLMPYFDIDDFHKFIDSAPSLEMLYTRFESNRDSWMKGWKKASAYI